MSKHVNAIAGRLSLRKPQRESLEILHRITEIAPPKKDADLTAALAAIRSEYPMVADFEREFPSLCFALATGVGKTRLMGAFVAYLHAAHGLNNFFVLAPSLTIYQKLIADFTLGTRKYVFKGLSEFAVEPPHIVTGESYEQASALPLDAFSRCTINVFNISKINSEVRGGKLPRIKRLSEYIGQSYFDYLAGLPDLVLLMDESHRYRASAGVRAINELKPILGLELTATPLVEGKKGESVRFQNVIYDYALGRAMEDGFVKEPAVVTRKDFSTAGMTEEQIERIKLEDGIRLHEATKVELDTYARQAEVARVKPFLLVIAKDTTHAAKLLAWIESEEFFGGAYKGKAIQVDSSRSGTEEEEMIARLLAVESPDEPTEIVIHVHMLKEGWDVTNLYTIVPLRAANARVLVEQSIGRGLRLPYGRRTGVDAVDRLSIVAHDKFQEIVDEAKRPDSSIRLRSIVLDPRELERRTTTVVSAPILDVLLGLEPEPVSLPAGSRFERTRPLFTEPADAVAARQVDEVIRRFAEQPDLVPSLDHLERPEVQAAIVQEVRRRHPEAQPSLNGIETGPDLTAITATVARATIDRTINIPRITIVPKGSLRWEFVPFQLDLATMAFPPVSEDLWVQHLRTGAAHVVSVSGEIGGAQRLEDYVVFGLVAKDDVEYDEHGALLYELAGQVVRHLRRTLDEGQTRKVLQCYQRTIVDSVHAQMQQHCRDAPVEYEARISRSFTKLKHSAYTHSADEPVLDYRQALPARTSIGRHLFGGFSKSLYDIEKFGSEPERVLAGILERDSTKWFRPRLGQFQLYYRAAGDEREYQPDFVAEVPDAIYMLEPKDASEMSDPVVQAKRAAAIQWCRHASEHAATIGGKPWRYALIPHDSIASNMTLEGLVRTHGASLSG